MHQIKILFLLPIDQSQLETTRALNELREYCKSPKCDAWKITSRLTSPSRFAEFVAGMSENGASSEFSLLNTVAVLRYQMVT